MTAVEIPVEKWPGAVREVTLGGSYGGGTRTSTVTVGGETTLPFLGFEGALPHRPALAVEVVRHEGRPTGRPSCRPPGATPWTTPPRGRRAPSSRAPTSSR